MLSDGTILETKDIYNLIAKDFDRTRNAIWQCVLNFSKSFNKESKILDLGCGNGKNMQYLLRNGHSNVIGCDISTSFVEICKKKRLNVIEANIMNLPYEDNTFDYIICIAVLHHLETEEDRLKGISEMMRILKPDGKILITVSSYESPFYKNMDMSRQDVLVPWKNSYGAEICKRFYHFFKQYELDELCKKSNATIKLSIFEHDNWVVVI